MKIVSNNSATILLELETRGFRPGVRDTARCRVMERRNQDGHTDLRISLNLNDENKVNDISVYGFVGGAAQLLDWSMDLTGGAPLDALMAFIRAA